MTTRGDPVKCWACGKSTDSTTAVIGEDSRPDAGDVSICFGCGELAIFTGHDLETRRPTDDERAEALDEPDVIRARGAVLAFIAEHGRQ